MTHTGEDNEDHVLAALVTEKLTPPSFCPILESWAILMNTALDMKEKTEYKLQRQYIGEEAISYFLLQPPPNLKGRLTIFTLEGKTLIYGGKKLYLHSSYDATHSTEK